MISREHTVITIMLRVTMSKQDLIMHVSEIVIKDPFLPGIPTAANVIIKLTLREQRNHVSNNILVTAVPGSSKPGGNLKVISGTVGMGVRAVVGIDMIGSSDESIVEEVEPLIRASFRGSRTKLVKLLPSSLKAGIESAY